MLLYYVHKQDLLNCVQNASYYHCDTVTFLYNSIFYDSVMYLGTDNGYFDFLFSFLPVDL